MYSLVWAGDSSEYAGGIQDFEPRFAELMLREGAPPAASRWKAFGTVPLYESDNFSAYVSRWQASPDGKFILGLFPDTMPM